MKDIDVYSTQEESNDSFMLQEVFYILRVDNITQMSSLPTELVIAAFKVAELQLAQEV